MFDRISSLVRVRYHPPPLKCQQRENTERKGEPLAREVKANRSVTLHAVSNLDGSIAKKDNSVSWLESPADAYEPGVSEDSAGEGIKIDCFVLGSRTYEHALQLGWPYGDTPTVVTTSRELPSTRKSVEFYSGDLKRLVEEILAPRYENIWLVGGAMLCQFSQSRPGG